MITTVATVPLSPEERCWLTSEICAPKMPHGETPIYDDVVRDHNQGTSTLSLLTQAIKPVVDEIYPAIDLSLDFATFKKAK